MVLFYCKCQLCNILICYILVEINYIIHIFSFRIRRLVRKIYNMLQKNKNYKMIGDAIFVCRSDSGDRSEGREGRGALCAVGVFHPRSAVCMVVRMGVRGGGTFTNKNTFEYF